VTKVCADLAKERTSTYSDSAYLFIYLLCGLYFTCGLWFTWQTWPHY